MKKSIAYLLSVCCIACSADKKTYTENGLTGSVKTMIEKEYAPIEQRFGKWEAVDSTKPVRYWINRYDTAGNKIETEYHVITSEDYMLMKTIHMYDGNKKTKSNDYDYFGKIIGYTTYKYDNENSYTTTSYDTSGNISFVSANKVNPENKHIFFYKFVNYENKMPVSTMIREDVVVDDTISIIITDKNTGIKSTTKSTILEKDAMGNFTKVLYFDSTNTRPEMLSIRTYEYY